MEAVTAVLVDRTREQRGLNPMLAGSLALHALVAAAVLFGPARWLTGAVADAPKVVMTVSLGGAGRGPDVGGANPLGGRPVQKVATPAPSAAPEAVRPPAARMPAMTLPAPAAAKKPRAKAAKAEPPPPEVKFAPEGATGRTPIPWARRRNSGRVSPRRGSAASGWVWRRAAAARGRRSTSGISAARTISGS